MLFPVCSNAFGTSSAPRCCFRQIVCIVLTRRKSEPLHLDLSLTRLRLLPRLARRSPLTCTHDLPFFCNLLDPAVLACGAQDSSSMPGQLKRWAYSWSLLSSSSHHSTANPRTHRTMPYMYSDPTRTSSRRVLPDEPGYRIRESSPRPSGGSSQTRNPSPHRSNNGAGNANGSNTTQQTQSSDAFRQRPSVHRTVSSYGAGTFVAPGLSTLSIFWSSRRW